MSKLQLKNWGLVLSILMTMLASPIAGLASCTSCATHQQATKTDEDCCGQIAKDHCPPEFNSVNQAADLNVETFASNNVEAKIQIGCRCLKDASQGQTVLAKQQIQPQHCSPIISPTELKFPPINQTTVIVFFKPNLVYTARSSLTDLPARAPPVL